MDYSAIGSNDLQFEKKEFLNITDVYTVIG